MRVLTLIVATQAASSCCARWPWATRQSGIEPADRYETALLAARADAHRLGRAGWPPSASPQHETLFALLVNPQRMWLATRWPLWNSSIVRVIDASANLVCDRKQLGSCSDSSLKLK